MEEEFPEFWGLWEFWEVWSGGEEWGKSGEELKRLEVEGLDWEEGFWEGEEKESLSVNSFSLEENLSKRGSNSGKRVEEDLFGEDVSRLEFFSLFSNREESFGKSLPFSEVGGWEGVLFFERVEFFSLPMEWRGEDKWGVFSLLLLFFLSFSLGLGEIGALFEVKLSFPFSKWAPFRSDSKGVDSFFSF